MTVKIKGWKQIFGFEEDRRYWKGGVPSEVFATPGGTAFPVKYDAFGLKGFDLFGDLIDDRIVGGIFGIESCVKDR